MACDLKIHGLNWLISKVLGWSAKCDYPPRKSCLLDFNLRRLFKIVFGQYILILGLIVVVVIIIIIISVVVDIIIIL